LKYAFRALLFRRTMLLTDKQEKFAHNVAVKGMNYTQAWEAAGYSMNYPLSTLQPNASRLAAKSKVKARIEALRDEIIGPDVMSKREMANRLTAIARAKLVDFVDAEGNIKLENGESVALAELTIEDWQKLGKTAVSRTKKIKLHDPLQAMRDIAKIADYWGKDETNINIDNRSINIYVESKEDKESLEWLKRGKLPSGD
jgi:phage terminase small subunit